MKRYCVDTSGFSTPLERMPDDIYRPIWERVIEVLESGFVAVTTEIYTEMQGSLRGVVGEFIDAHRDVLVLEIGDDAWDWQSYRNEFAAMEQRHHDFISEYNNDRQGTVSVNDISIVALAKSIGAPLVSMEAASGPAAIKRRKIPDVCRLEGVEHLTFNDFLRREKITFPRA